MKGLAVLSIFVLFAFLSEARKSGDYYKKLYTQCSQEFGYTEEDFKRNLKAMNHEFGCLTICVLKKSNEYKDNEIDKGAVISNLVEMHGEDTGNKVKDLVVRCVNEGNKQAGECEKGRAYIKCIFATYKNTAAAPAQ